MRILRFLLRSAGPLALVMAGLSIASGGFNAGLLATIHRTLTDGPRRDLLLAFIGLGGGKVLSGYFSGVLLTEHSHGSMTELRKELIQKLLAFPYQRFEAMGRARVLSALTEDVSVVNAALQAMPLLVVNAAIVAGGGAYLAYLSPRTLLLLAGVAVASMLVYRPASRRARPYLRRARDEHDKLFGHFRALTEGTKELKQHAGRRRAFLDQQVLETTESLMELHIAGISRHHVAQAAIGFFSLLAIAVILFLAPSLQAGGPALLSGYVLTALYLTGPLGATLRSLPLLSTADIALRRIEELGVELGSGKRERTTRAPERPGFERVVLRDVVHRYTTEERRDAFTLGPLTLELLPGEIVFITGDNGSGKSTLAKLLVGLYEPESGSVLCDGAEVTDATRDDYRQLFSVVFSDYYLFESLLGLTGDDLDARAARLVERLALRGHVDVKDGQLSSLQLSHGQRKRLALLTAYLEDRPIYLFDEWASDQDPSFKEVFYRELLPELKARGKTVVVVTHDDRYFDVADRRIALRNGRMH